jgi:hypothetical protein
MKVVDEKHPWSDVRMGRRGEEMGLPSTGLRSVALLQPISEAKPRSAGRSRELSSSVVPEKGHGSWYEGLHFGAAILLTKTEKRYS